MSIKRMFLRGFVITLALVIVAVLLSNPRLGLAQEEVQTNFDPGALQMDEAAMDGPALLTDHPEGRLPGEAPVGVPEANMEGIAESSPGTEIDFDQTNQIAEPPDEIPADNIILDGPKGELEGTSRLTDPGVLVIPGADFRNDGFDPDGYFFTFSGGYFHPKSAAICMMAPAYLPHGATITAFWATAYDNTATGAIQYLSLFRLDNYSGTTTTLASVSTTNAYVNSSLFTIGDSTIANPLVLFPDYSYYVAGCLSEYSSRIYNIRIYYD